MDAASLYKLALQKFDEDKHDDANRYLEEAIDAQEKYEALYYWKRVELAGSWRHGEDSKQPIQDLTNIINLSIAQMIDALHNRALWSLHQGFDDDVLRDLDWVISLGHRSSSTFMLRAYYRAKRGQLMGAIDDCTSAYALEPSPEPLLKRGHHFYSAKLYDDAIEDFKSLLSLDLKTIRSASYAAAVLRWLGKAYYKKGDFENALKSLQNMALYQDDGPYARLEDYQVELGD